MSATALTGTHAPEACPECQAAGLIRDRGTGEVVCPRCGLVVDIIVDRGPEWVVYEPEDMAQVRGTPTLIPALSGSDGTYLARTWTHRDPEAGATMHRLRHQQRRTGDTRGRNFHHAKKELFMLGDRAHAPRTLIEEAADIYRRAYNRNLTRGRSINGVVAASIYTAYRLHRVPRSAKEMAQTMGVEPKELTRVYRLLIEELHLSPENPQAEAHVPKLAADLGLTAEESQVAIETLREARRLKETMGKDPRGLAAAAVYVAQLSRPGSRRITQAQIAQASGVTEVTIRNRFKALLKIADGFLPVSTISTVSTGTSLPEE